MKKRPFLAGMATMALIGGLTFSALAASGSFTITVAPINVQVNGVTFQPKDAKGNDVPVFSYNGTTYAPLRALAEAYGLEVGYDSKTNMATVGETATPTTDLTAEEVYQSFKALWTRTPDLDSYGSKASSSYSMTVSCADIDKLKDLCAKASSDTMETVSIRYSNEISQEYQGKYLVSVTYYFDSKAIWTDLPTGNGHGTSFFQQSAVQAL